jgi:hypothetical protein
MSDASIQIIHRIDASTAQIRTAAQNPVTKIPALLSDVVANLSIIRRCAESCPPEERGAVLARLKDFHSNLRVFSRAMDRGAVILQGYSQRAGISRQEYCPGGASISNRDPAFFSLSA